MLRARTQEIRRFILERLEDHPEGISRQVQDRFGITRQSCHAHLRSLEEEGLIEGQGRTRARAWRPKILQQQRFNLPMTMEPAEDEVWRSLVAPRLGPLPAPLLEICQFGLGELVANAFTHAAATGILLGIQRSGARLRFIVRDDGVGIFTKLRRVLELSDERHVLLELAKGRLSSDPERRAGQGLFFTARAFDGFAMEADGLRFVHHRSEESWYLEEGVDTRPGTRVLLELDLFGERHLEETFARFRAPNGFGFTRTRVPLTLARYRDEGLMSRSQARRVAARLELFEEVWLDFRDVPTLGPAFAEELFRVWAAEHPEVKLHWVEANEAVARQIEAVGA
jgi:anti-sigma regulatory factor (Ser/Thr protein kinase)